MKQIIYGCLVLGILFYSSCTTELEKEGKKDLITIGLNPGGEFSDSKERVQNKESQNSDLFALQIFDILNDKPYAYVVGDSIPKVRIDFIKDHEYEVKMTYLKNARNIVRYIPENIWGDPFVAGYSETELNQVYYSSATKLRGISSSFIDTESSESPLRMGKYVEVDRYHGILNSFIATEDSTTLNIKLKRMVFGIRLNIEIIEEEVDTLKFTINSMYHQKEYIIPISEGKGNLEIPYLSLGFPNMYSDELDTATGETYEENVKINIGTIENPIKFYDGTIRVIRNAMMVLTFRQNTTTGSSNNSLDLLLEEGEMEEEEFYLSANQNL
ncbi:hypothetical protein V6B16_04725 [Salinimicrobium catena]|uniref:hypothetical protein n=1 Tax=Salinimicrobium catena TaxID=390640 RepID=UPI002FE4F3D6